MRELKFRAWVKPIKKMALVKGWLHGSVFLEADSGSGSSDIKDVILMQYTGLKDKNGKEIYEGDIVEVAWGKGETYHKGSVIFYNGQFQVEIEGSKTTLSHFGQKWVEVIGNIHENKELLK